MCGPCSKRETGGIRAELLDVVLDLRVEAGDQSGYQHDHADAEHYAEDGQKTAQFVCAERVHRLL